MNMKKTTSFVFLLVVLSLTLSASAKYITISNTITMERIVYGEETTINVSLENTGDEPAYDVQLSLLLPDKMTATPIFLGKVDPMMPQSATFNIKVDPSMNPGTYTASILTEYKDANKYPFSSVSPNTLILREPRSSQISGIIQELSLGSKGEVRRLRLEMRNMDGAEHSLKLRIFAPKELKVTPPEKTVSIAGRSESVQELDVSSFGALEGSSYTVFASLDYDEGGAHYSSTAVGMVKIVKQEDVLGFWLPVIALALIIVAFVVYQFKK
jgi:hypothetical protein